MLLLDDLLLSPIGGLKFILRQIQTLAEQQLNSEDSLKEQLLELQLQLENGEIEESEFVLRETEIFERLRVIKQSQLDLMQSAVHTADSSSLIVEMEQDYPGSS